MYLKVNFLLYVFFFLVKLIGNVKFHSTTEESNLKKNQRLQEFRKKLQEEPPLGFYLNSILYTFY